MEHRKRADTYLPPAAAAHLPGHAATPAELLGAGTLHPFLHAVTKMHPAGTPPPAALFPTLCGQNKQTVWKQDGPAKSNRCLSSSWASKCCIHSLMQQHATCSEDTLTLLDELRCGLHLPLLGAHTLHLCCVWEGRRVTVRMAFDRISTASLSRPRTEQSQSPSLLPQKAFTPCPATHRAGPA